MKLTIQELIGAAQAANEKANAAFTAIGILRWHFDDKEVVALTSLAACGSNCQMCLRRRGK